MPGTGETWGWVGIPLLKGERKQNEEMAVGEHWEKRRAAIGI